MKKIIVLTCYCLIFSTANAQFSAEFELTDLNGLYGFKINGENSGDKSGYSVSNAGDINGDGFSDILIGAYESDSGSSYGGISYVIFGSDIAFNSELELASLGYPDGFKIVGDVFGGKSGYSVSSLGDFNDDGFDDIVIGSPYALNNQAKGISYIIFGKGDSFDNEINLSGLQFPDGIKLNGEVNDDRSGISVAGVGDVNEDGFDDLVIGAYWNDGGGSNSGASYVVFGSSSPENIIDLANLNGSNGFKIYGEGGNNQLGRQVAGIGDINNDGIMDIAMSAPNNSTSVLNQGAVYIIFGKNTAQSGLFSSPFDLSSLSGVNGFKINGVNRDDKLARSISMAGDINNDNINDFIIGANAVDSNGNNAGASYVVFGKDSTQGNNFPALFNLASLDGANGFKLVGELESDLLGVSVAGVGDVNGNGVDDIITTATGTDQNGSQSGSAHIIYGMDTLNMGDFPSVINVMTLNGNNGFKVNGEAENDSYGISASGAGDFNGDGLSDFIVGAHLADPNGNNSGSSYVIYGRVLPIAVDDFKVIYEDAQTVNLNVLSNDTDPSGIADVTAITQPEHGLATVINDGAEVSYLVDSNWCGDEIGDSLQYTLNDNSSAYVGVFVYCVNDAPDFSYIKELHIGVNGVGLFESSTIACLFESGPANESDQSILDFQVNIESDPNNILNAFDVANNGEINYLLSNNLGTAVVSLKVQDDGGTENNGVDTSAAKQITIHTGDYIFVGGMESNTCQ